ncbi:type II secretion system F family protein [Leifsonia sp. NPDC056824]|uniref:type II secretion system F family protein n=1 Tax=Leifsonia sp. NPDC056824 TaxID=3345953 RepID=UPI0036A5FAEC
MSERRKTGHDRSGRPADDLLSGSVEALAVLLDAGISPRSAWEYVAAEATHPAVVRAATLVAAGVPPSEALAAAARRGRVGAGSDGMAVRAWRGRVTDGGDGGGDAGVAAVAAAWAVADHAGASLAPALRGAAEALRDRAGAERDIATALAGPRATARLMSWLPLVGVVMAYAIGVDVIGTLVTGPLGWMAAGSGCGLLIAGRSWTRTLVRSAARAGPVSGIEHDLTAIALAGGMSVPAARETIAQVVRRSGLDAVVDSDASVDRVLRIAERAGAPAIELLSAEARQRRRTARAEGRRRAELLAVRLLLPLGVCVLPAFVLLGVVPVILGMMSSTFAGLT